MTTATVLPTKPYSNRGKNEFVNVKAYATATVDPGSLTTHTGTSGTVTVPGADLGEPVMVSYSGDLQAQVLTAYVSDGNTVTWVLFNSTGSTIDLASGTMYFTVLNKIEGTSAF